MKVLSTIKNVAAVLFSIFFIPLIYFVGEYFDIRWLRITCLIVFIPVILLWGFKGYNWVFGKKTPEELEKEAAKAAKAEAEKQ